MCSFDFELYTPSGEKVCRLMEIEIMEDRLTCIFRKGLLDVTYLKTEGEEEYKFTKMAVLRPKGPYKLVVYADVKEVEPYVQEGFYIGKVELEMMPGRRLGILEMKAKASSPINLQMD